MKDFTYFNPTRMHVFTHLKPASQGVTGLGTYPDGMVELDGYVGQLLDKLDELKVADNTIVVFTTDNGAPAGEGKNQPFSGLKNSLMEGGIRTPLAARLPGVIPAGLRVRENFSATDLLPTSLAMAGVSTSTGFEGKNRTDILTSPTALNTDPVCMRYVYGGKVLRAVIKENWKLAYDENTGLTRLFDLASDPAETTDLAGANPAVVESLKADWNAWSATFPPGLGVW